jgi:hypothetical protein
MLGWQMTENEQTENMGFLDSKFNRVFMILVTMLLLFAGPTYVPFLMVDIAGLGTIAGMAVGIVLFVLGLGLLVYLVRKKAIT